MRYFYLLLLLFSVIACDSSSKKHHTPGELNKKFTTPDLDPLKWKERFENEQRDVFKHRYAIIEALSIKKGDIIADIGAGTGGFLPLLNQAVGEKGKVYAVEISDGFILYLKQRALGEGLKQVEVIKASLKKSMLPQNKVDTILLIDVYHHLDHPVTMLKDYYQALKANGVLAIVDFERLPDQSRDWVLKHISKSKKEYIKEIEAHGFELIKEVDIPFAENFMLLFKKQ